ncbi:MAG: sulfatase [Deltaproteobacteria bacterium]|nr:sulfatase [Deltaproteobacteria bacterium]
MRSSCAMARALVVILATGLLLDSCRLGQGRSNNYECTDCNVVLISIDTLRADHVGTYGYSRPTTPNIDALSKTSVVFEDAIAQSSWTRAAHMSIFTGLHPREHGYIALADRRRLDDKVATLASVLRENGYTTAAFVGGVNVAAEYGFDQGFDVYRSNGKFFRDNFQDAMYWLDGNEKSRFFLFLHGYDAHTPYASDPIDRLAIGVTSQMPRKGLRKTCTKAGAIERIQPFVEAYDAAVHRADRYVGKILADLERRHLLERTIVVLLSDHGEEFLEHGRCFHLSTLYREVLHVPLIVKAPGLAPRRVAGLVSASVTIAPTIAGLVGIRTHPFPAAALIDAALGGAVPTEAVVSETERSIKGEGFGHLRAITTANRKLIDWLSQRRREYFRTDEDAGEARPLTTIAEGADLDEELERWTGAHVPMVGSGREEGERTSDVPVPGASPSSAPSPEQDEKLRSLGYIE